MLEVYYRYLPMYSLDSPPDAIGTIQGRVTDATTEKGIPGAKVRLDLAERPAVEVLTDPTGAYVLYPPEVPEFFAMSASHTGYVPKAVNVATSMVLGRTLELNFALQPESEMVIAIEAVPEVHHLGDDRFDGRINSKFQKSAEGSVFSADFQLAAETARRGAGSAELAMLTKGVQLSHRILINGEVLDDRLDHSPSDGGFGEFVVEFDASLLREGTNTVQIRASSNGSDVDDFEFVNLRVRLTR
jgi:hypothetical protein